MNVQIKRMVRRKIKKLENPGKEGSLDAELEIDAMLVDPAQVAVAEAAIDPLS